MKKKIHCKRKIKEGKKKSIGKFGISLKRYKRLTEFDMLLVEIIWKIIDGNVFTSKAQFLLHM